MAAVRADPFMVKFKNSLREVMSASHFFRSVITICAGARVQLAVASPSVAASVAHLVSMKMIERLVSMLRKWTVIAMMWIEAVVNMSAELVSAMEPWARSDEYA